LDKYQSEEKLKFYSWGMQGYSQLYEVKPDDKWPLFVFRETDRVIENKGNGVISEGVGTAALLAKDLKNERFSDYEKCYDGNISFLKEEEIIEIEYSQLSQIDENDYITISFIDKAKNVESLKIK